MNIKNNYFCSLLSKRVLRTLTSILMLLSLWIIIAAPKAFAATSLLADQPIRATTSIPANVMLALSVEWPTGVVQAYNDEATDGCPGRDVKGDSVCYFASKTYIGYFDPYKCYLVASGQFEPVGFTSGASGASPTAGDHTCIEKWSGNFLNWATMQTTDEFRWAMTGGDRFIDTPTLTVLEKARHDGQGGFDQFPIKRIGGANVGTLIPVAPSTVTPYKTSPELFIRINGLNTVMWVSENRTLLTANNHPEVNNPNNNLNLPTTPPNIAILPLYVRVKVCDQTNYPETQTKCIAYTAAASTSYKPEGIIQENALRMRFGAFGYLLDNDQLRDGGVLRARMKDTGPTKPVPGSLPITNTAAEWKATDGTYITNPDAADASATGFGATNSGVMQYLNKFGRKARYKSFDPYSELYAEVLKYFKAKQPTATYFSGLDDTMVDGFPVITNWNDPIQYACQKNFIVGISDSNTHKDKNLNGGISNAENEPPNPGGLDTDYNVTTLTNTVGDLESPAIASLANYRNCCNGSAFLAGLAYYAHTTDLRPDFSNQPNGKQTISSYFVDVRESGSWGTTGDPRNQLWLAAKFGGFKYSPAENQTDTPVTFDSTRLWANASAGTVQGYPVPSNYFAANQPNKLVNGLRAAFNDINSQIASAAGGNLASTDVSILSTNNAFYKVQYNTSPWRGNVQGILLDSITATGTFNQTIKWNADDKLDLLATGSGFNTARVIVTAVPGATPIGQPFRIGTISTSQKNALGSTATEQQDILNYLRGDRSKEILGADGNTNTGGLYRTRSKLLGDIVDSEAVYVGAPVEAYDDALNPGYSAFATAKLARRALLYVGANDGMLHAFDARTDGNPLGGTEVFAFIPSFMFSGPNASPSTDGLRSLANDPLNHRFFVNRTPKVKDIDFDKAGSATGSGTSDWRSILVGGLGKGGKGYYAIDITDPASFSSESGAAAKVLWEFSDPDMGFSYGIPVITKTRKWGWVVILSSGYNNVTSPTVANRGKGYLFVVNPKTGALIKKVALNAGSATDPSGFAQITSYVPAETSGLVDEVYGGDLLGNVWRVDFKSASADPVPIIFATLKDGITNKPQPITTAPVVDFSPNDNKRYVFVGTGRYLDSSDSLNTQQQTFYALRDGSSSARFEDTATPTSGFSLPSGASFPLDRSQLVSNSDLVTGLTAAQIEAKPMGWYYDLTGATGGTPNARERITVDSRTDSAGVITWAGTLPKTDACNPNGVSNLYSTNFGSGKTQLYTKDASGLITPIAKLATEEIVKLQIVNNDGKRQILISGLNDPSAPLPPVLGYDAGRFTNWREILQ